MTPRSAVFPNTAAADYNVYVFAVCVNGSAKARDMTCCIVFVLSVFIFIDATVLSALARQGTHYFNFYICVVVSLQCCSLFWWLQLSCCRAGSECHHKWYALLS